MWVPEASQHKKNLQRARSRSTNYMNKAATARIKRRI